MIVISNEIPWLGFLLTRVCYKDVVYDRLSIAAKITHVLMWKQTPWEGSYPSPTEVEELERVFINEVHDKLLVELLETMLPTQQ